MAREIINVGAEEDDGTGEPLRNAWIKVNNMTSEIYTTFGDGSTLSSAGGVVPVEDDGSEIVAAPSALNFTGAGVTVTDVSGVATIDIPGGGSGTVDVVSNVATNTILGRTTAGSGDSEELTAAQVRTLLNVEDGADVSPVTSVAGETGVISAGDLRTALNVEDGAAADQTGAEIVSALDTELGGSTWQSGGGSVPVEDDGSEIVAAPTAINFTGAGVTVTDVSGVATVDIPSSGGSSAIDDLTDVEIDSGVLSDGDIGRAIGLVSRGPDTYGLLPPLTSVPVSGGVDILASNDFSSNNGTDLVASNTHLYDEVYIVGYDLSSGDVDLFFRPDGVNPSVWDIERIRLSTSGSTTVDEDWGTDRFWMGTGGSNHSFRAVIKGTKAGIPLMIERLFGTRSSGDFNYSTGIAKTLEECRAIAVTFQATITAGVVYIVGVKNSAQPLVVPVDYTGSPGGAGTLARFVLPLNAQVRSGASGNFRVDSNPSSEAVLNIDHEGTDIGTITIATNGDCTVSISSDTDLDAGDLLIIESTQAEDFTDLFGSLLLEGRE